jgi:hypothetical protein
MDDAEVEGFVLVTRTALTVAAGIGVVGLGVVGLDDP